MDQRAIINQMRNNIGQEIGVSDWFLVDQSCINQFCACTEDDQWIHTDAVRAAQGPFGKTIAPGFLVLSFISPMSRSRQFRFDASHVEMLLNYGLNKVRFLQPVPVNSKIRGRMILMDVEEKTPGRVLVTTQYTIEIEDVDEPACVAEVVGLFVLK